MRMILKKAKNIGGKMGGVWYDTGMRAEHIRYVHINIYFSIFFGKQGGSNEQETWVQRKDSCMPYGGTDGSGCSTIGFRWHGCAGSESGWHCVYSGYE